MYGPRPACARGTAPASWVVYIGPAELKGTGAEHRAIQSARAAYLSERASGQRLPYLGWLDGDQVTDPHGSVLSLPPCMTADYTAPLPAGRAALAGDVADPWTDLRDRVAHENRERACPAGQHGTVRERRTVTQPHNAKGEPAGPQAFGPWEPSQGNWCKADYTYHQVYTEDCSWYQGEPFNKTMTGTATWQIPITVTAHPDQLGESVETTGDPEFVSNTCWDGPPPVPPVPTSTVTTATEARTATCPAGFEGSIGQERTKTTATTTYPWGEAPLVSVEYTSWSETANTCTAICPPPCGGGPDGDGPDGDGPGGPGPGPGNTGGEDPSEFGGTGQPGDDGFGGSPGDSGSGTGGNDGSGDGTGGGDDGGSGP